MHLQILIKALPVVGEVYKAGEGFIICITAIVQKVGEERCHYLLIKFVSARQE
jgi:hypothetical protein